MSKAILVIDTPSCCEMCDLRCLSYWHGNDFCSASEEVDIDYTNYKTKRNEKCPLKELPKWKELKENEDGTAKQMFDIGFNNCLAKILGEENE